jgi:hypothetical protein
MLYSVEYYGYGGKAWFDRAALSKTVPWYYQAVPVDSLCSMNFSKSKLASATAFSALYAQHTQNELYYNGDGSWGTGYVVVTNDYPNGHPLIRTSASLAMGYLASYAKLVYRS